MRLFEFINEAPLPDDWDAEIFNPRVPFTKRVAYAKERAKQVGRGTARIAFEIPYEGRKTVLKIAMNGKGAAQNEAEISALSDGYLSSMELLIPMIDADDNGTWIHMEYAEKAKPNDFVKHTGVDLSTLVQYFMAYKKWVLGQGGNTSPEPTGINTESELFQKIEEYVSNYGQTAHIEDYGKVGNWGIYNGHLVVIDAGWDHESAKLYKRG